MPTTLKTAKPSLASQTPAGGLTLSRKVAQANRWREQYNPLRGLTIARAVALLECYFRGEMADLQWCYFFIEQTDPDLFALVERRTSAITSLDWNIKVTPENKRRSNFDEKLAEDQAAFLREQYDAIDNLYEAIDHLAMATFRGFAHLELHRKPDGSITHLEPLDQWNVVRNGLRGEWKYNPDARSTTFSGVSEDNLIDPAQWLVRDTKRHVNRIALIKFIRQNLSQKDWDAFIEIYGLPATIIVGPPNVPTDKESEYKSAAEGVSEGGSGYLPYGSTVHTADGPRGVNPFRDHLRYLQEQLILAGTGGLLTMLTQSGSGTLAGSAHKETFDKIAEAEARKISSGVFQRQLDLPSLSLEFPGKPILAYFDLAAEAQEDVGAIVDQVSKLSTAGYVIDPSEVSEKTGLTVELKGAISTSPPGDLPGDPAKDPVKSPMGNRTKFKVNPLRISKELLAAAQSEVGKALADDLQPLRNRLERILQISDPEVLVNRLRSFLAELPALAKDLLADPAAASPIAQSLNAGLFNGLAVGAEARKTK